MSNFKRKIKKNQEKRGIVVDIDAILDDVSNAQNETQINQCIEKHLANYNGDKNAVEFALGVGVLQGMPLGIYVYCLVQMGFTEEEAIMHFKYFVRNHVKSGAFETQEEAEQYINDMIDTLHDEVEQFVGEDGQMKVVLEKDGVKTTHDVAYLMAEAFIPNPDNLPHVRHKNGDKQDNRAENLEWCNEKEF